MNKTKIPDQDEIEETLQNAGLIKELANFRRAIARGDKIGAVGIARRAGVLPQD